jgi:hypothetical protein
MNAQRILRVAAVLLILVAPVRGALADEVTDWNQTLFRAALVAGSSPLAMTRNTAIVQAAVYDAVNGIERRYTAIFVKPAAPTGASMRAAAMQAAYVALSKLYGTTPALQAMFDAHRAASLADISAGENAASVAAGIAWGDSVANQIWTWRSNDGIQLAPSPWLGNTGVGQWRQTPNAPLPGTSAPGAGYPQFVGMTPWAIVSPSVFRAVPPPALTSARYTRDFNEVKAMGSQASATRTADQTIFALVWASGTASYLWNNAAVQLLDGSGGDGDNEAEAHSRNGRRGLLEHARILAAMDVAMADAAIGCWDTKYTFNLWRPITGIREAANDGNDATAADAGWTPLISTPAHPSYTSGHSCVSAAAAGILAHEFGEHTRFTIESDQMPGVVRSFNTFNAALEEVKDARVFAGIHWRFDCERGQAIGEAVASYILENSFQRMR